ncbi:hypothetical protein QAD02_004566 [Eretmocerus hayati]|uniref:Uncharacterized protein n=1 Tax=Eretmocerus hayati TaxID=131215 RepID=A0ACC2NQD7_9HYME|nr:hypothetical protein QAD02_004566 [Eretmocerus hayati]
MDLAIAIEDTGVTATQMNILFTSMEMPTVSSAEIQQYGKHLKQYRETLAEKSCAETAEKKRKLTLEAQAIFTEREAAGSVVQYSFTVAIRRDFMYHCSGSVIDKNHVVTAAHCVYHEFDEESRRSALEVIVGIDNYHEVGLNKGLVISVVKVYIPKEYERVIEKDVRVGDIAVLKLAKNLDLSFKNKKLSKLFLPAPSNTYFGANCYITGFGWDQKKSKSKLETNEINELEDSSGKLRALDTNVVHSTYCRISYREVINDKKFVCAAIKPSTPNTNEAVSIGDGGGPLVHNGDTLIGVLSSFLDKDWGGKKAPLLYTRVSAYHDFIIKSTKDQPDPNIITIDLPHFVIHPSH